MDDKSKEFLEATGGDARAAAPQPVQTAEDERAVFEAWYVADANAQFGHEGYFSADEIAALRMGDDYGPDRVALNSKWEGWQARAALASKPVQGGDPGSDKAERRLSPFDAVAEAMRLASLMGGSIGMSDVEKTKHYEQRLRSHLIEFMYPPAALSSAPAQPVREPMSEEKVEQARQEWLHSKAVPNSSAFVCGVRFAERHHGITKE